MGGRDHSVKCLFCHVWHGGLNETPCQCVIFEGLVRRANVADVDFNVFTEEALAANDGKVVPLTLEPGGPAVGQATFRYDSEEKALMASFRVADPKVAELLSGSPPSIFG